MAIERSHGKARPILPRASDLQSVETERKPSDGRGPGGRFAVGNRHAIGHGAKQAQKRLLGPAATQGDELLVRKDAWRIFTATMATMPVDAPPVRTLVSLHSRHASLNAYYSAKAVAAGLDTETGMKLQEASDRQSQRAERVLVTALDVARTLASKSRDSEDPHAAINAYIESKRAAEAK